jgi:SPP1 family predicted phage head-tail adaptor
MNSARLDQRITIQAQSQTQDDDGQPVIAWTTLVSCFAHVEDFKGHEYVAASATRDMVITKITVRYREDVTAAMRVVWRNTTYNIKAVLSQDFVYMTLMCERFV